jgi:hypothetical protein
MGFQYFNSSLFNTSHTLTEICGANNGYLLNNLTASYIHQLHDSTTLSASFLMFGLAAVFFILNLFSGLSDVSAILDPKVRVGLSSALSLFLPIMSYLFSEAKKADGGGVVDTGSNTELPQRARFILIWMLLVELLREKVEVIHMQGYSGTLERAGRVLWLGSLVYLNLHASGRKAMVAILWVVCVSKLVQRIAFTEFGKRSLAFGKNAGLISSYTAQVIGKDGPPCPRPEDTAEDLLKRCEYALMDEDKLVVEAIPSGYRLRKKKEEDVAATVGKIWGLAEAEDDTLLRSLDEEKRLRRMCLSFSLFKLLRRRFEHLPALPAAETRSYRQIVFRGLHENTNTDSALTPEAFFDVTNDELGFLCEYYHSVVPVVLASPFFLLANYFLLPLVIFALCIVAVVLCSNGDVIYAFDSLYNDNHQTYFGVVLMAACVKEFFKSRTSFLCLVDFTITFLLFVMFIYEVVWEFFVFLLSDWFLVSLLCKYASKTKPLPPRSRALVGCSVRCILLARSLMHRPSISFNQFSVLDFCGVTMPVYIPLKFPILVREIPVPKQVKESIADYLTRLYDRDGNVAPSAPILGNGSSALRNYDDLLPFCECESVAEVILTWHIATSLLEVEHPPPSGSNNVATTVSKYCAYLVAFHPELLPDNQDSVERVFKDMKLELFQLLGVCSYYFSPCRSTRYRKIKASLKPPDETPLKELRVVVKGATLGRMLADKVEHYSAEDVWKLLAGLWVELIVYIAPSSADQESVRAHENVLAKGGEFITVLWAMATHAGMSRPDNVVPIHHTGDP